MQNEHTTYAKDIFHPQVLFTNSKELKDFCSIEGYSTTEDIEGLRALLLILEEDELYEWCSIVRDELRKREP